MFLFRLLPAFVALALAGSAVARGAPQGHGLDYAIHPIPLADRTDLEVSLAFSPDAPGPVIIGLPRDCYGVPDLERSVVVFEGQGGTTVAATDKPEERRVTPGQDGKIRLRYRLSFDPAHMDDFAFSPNAGPGHLHLGGCQWMLRIGDENLVRPTAIRLVDPPKGWRFYSTEGADALKTESLASYEQMNSSALGGGAGTFAEFQIEGRPLRVFVADGLGVPADRIVDSVRAIVAHERRAMGDYDFPVYTVAVRPRSGVIAGTALRDTVFVTFVKPSATLEELQLLLAHEMFHNWLPNKATVENPVAPEPSRFEWLHEGVDEYMARRLLLDAGLMSEDRFVELFNGDLMRIAYSPYGSITAAELALAQREHRFDSFHKKLSYWRGALIGLAWDTELSREGSPRRVLDLVRDMTRAAGPDHTLSEDAFFALTDGYGLDARADFDRWIVKGQPLAPPADAFGPGWVLAPVTVPSWKPGFEIAASYRARKLVGVVEGGAAWRAGLRDGMTLVDLKGTNPSANGWKIGTPVTVTVEEAGARRDVTYAPEGPPIQVLQYRRR